MQLEEAGIHVEGFGVFEGAFILARATGDPIQVRRQLGHYRK